MSPVSPPLDPSLIITLKKKKKKHHRVVKPPQHLGPWGWRLDHSQAILGVV
jgi:hypothetical protein